LNISGLKIKGDANRGWWGSYDQI